MKNALGGSNSLCLPNSSNVLQGSSLLRDSRDILNSESPQNQEYTFLLHKKIMENDKVSIQHKIKASRGRE